MSIWSISDLHFDYSTDKPMDIFGGEWENHKERIIESWKNFVSDEDLVLVAGDISWGLKLEEAKADLDVIEALPGKKIITKGNHDLWWQSLTKLNALEYKTICFLQNNIYTYDKYQIGGTRGWCARDSKGFGTDDEKIFRRELIRLENSLVNMSEDCIKIAMIHYPPFNMNGEMNEFGEIMVKYGISKCVYGHIHSERTNQVRTGLINGIEFVVTSCDLVDCTLQKIY